MYSSWPDHVLVSQNTLPSNNYFLVIYPWSSWPNKHLLYMLSGFYGCLDHFQLPTTKFYPCHVIIIYLELILIKISNCLDLLSIARALITWIHFRVTQNLNFSYNIEISLKHHRSCIYIHLVFGLLDLLLWN